MMREKINRIRHVMNLMRCRRNCLRMVRKHDREFHEGAINAMAERDLNLRMAEDFEIQIKKIKQFRR